MFVLFFFAASSNEFRKYKYVNYKKLKRPNKIVNLCSTVINKFEIYMAEPLQVLSNYLIFEGFKADKMTKLIDLRTNELLKSFGSKGQGSDEFISLWQIIRDKIDRDSFWICYITAKNLKKFDIKNILASIFYPEKIVGMPSEKKVPLFFCIYSG